MIKIQFYSKDWPKIEYAINHEYGKYRFLYLEMPNLKKRVTELWFKYILDEQKFDEMILSLNEQKIVVSKKKESE